MGLRGKMKKHKPIRLKILEGNRGRRKLPEEIIPPAEMPVPPAHLDAYALEEWNRVVEGLSAMGVLAGIDQQAFAAYCGAYARWRAAEEELAKLREVNRLSALVLKTVSGNWIQQPLIGISNKAAGDMVRYAVEFGMTPSARARLAMDPNRAKKGKFDGLVGVRGGKK
jgi:P27 family predicted phage terminase small subunit